MALALAGRDEQARAAAEEAERLAGRLHYPVGQAAKAEAAGATAEDAADCAAAIEEARARWIELGRPLDAARCLMLRGRLLAESDADEASELLRCGRRGVRGAGRTRPRRAGARGGPILMASWKQQALIEAPVTEVWELLCDPASTRNGPRT